mgnify:CR=1 FL=1
MGRGTQEEMAGNTGGVLTFGAKDVRPCISGMSRKEQPTWWRLLSPWAKARLGPLRGSASPDGEETDGQGPGVSGTTGKAMMGTLRCGWVGKQSKYGDG